MSTAQLLLAFTVGTASLAVWSYLRWPGAAPATLKSAVFRALVALALLHSAGGLIVAAVETVPAWGPVVLVATVVPVLTYAFLASLWFLKAMADQLRGAF